MPMLKLLLRPPAIPTAAASWCRPLPSARRGVLPVLSSFSSCAAMGSDSYAFGPYTIPASEVFHTTDLSFAMVNIRPVVPGHVLICPKREVKRFVDLSASEISDLWITAQTVGAKLEHYHKATSLTLNIQDGPQAGQTVPHVHIHILPRKSGDFAKNDEIYDTIDEKEKEMKFDLDQERVDRTKEEMAAEAAEYRALFC